MINIDMKHKKTLIIIGIFLHFKLGAQNVIELEGYSGVSVITEEGVEFEQLSRPASIDVGPYTPCGVAPSYVAGYVFVLNGIGVVIFEDLSWTLEKDRNNFMLSHHDNYYYDYLLNNCNALIDYGFICKKKNLRRLFVKRHFDGGKYVHEKQITGNVGNNEIESIVITEFPKFRKIRFNHFPDILMKQIRRESRNAYGLVVKMREQESSFIKEIHPLVFANKSDYLDSIVLWLVHNIIIKG